ncbi:hypothetical protein PIROE2DRAFT_13128 [Piromyces sp. E2]|nr:hypothetical protein PIROE2DRAFT_13128 [Piromyces sp. E2]|eukprot:OUM60970.1 hypothetical protein PIROE2DRAFT_13128 [Piromyces sp. E2]
MFKYNICFIVLLLLLYLNVYAINNNATYETIKMDDVLQLTVQSCKDDSDCKNYGGTCDNGKCFYRIYCIDNNCVSNHGNASYYSLGHDITMVEDIKVNGLILESCTNDSFKNKNCVTRLCNSNSDCFSNKCINSTCVHDDHSSLIFCGNTISEEITCGKNEFEICEKDEECYFRTCTEDKTCDFRYRMNLDSYFYHLLLKYLIIFLLILIIIVTVTILLIKRCRKH